MVLQRRNEAVIAAMCVLALYLVYFFYHSISSGMLRPSSIFAMDGTQERNCSCKKNEMPSLLPEMRFSNSVSPIIHQSWKTHHLPTIRSQRWSNTWKSCFPQWEHRIWSDDDNMALVRDHYPWFLPVYLGFKNPVERADLARYFYMFHYGGVYTDLDNVCVRNFTHLMSSHGLIFGGMDGLPQGELKTYVQNSFMASRPGHPFWMRLLSRIMLYRHLGKGGRPEFLTGPYAMMDELREYVKSEARDVIIYESKYFNPFSWHVNKIKECKNLGDMTDENEKACVASFPEAYVVQFHTQSWLAGHL